MRVIIDDRVTQTFDAFYNAAMERHISLSEETVMKKKSRLIESLKSLGDMPVLYDKARLKKEWMSAGWREFICEDFHVAYEICTDENDEDYVWVRDAEHSLLYH